MAISIEKSEKIHFSGLDRHLRNELRALEVLRQPQPGLRLRQARGAPN